MPLQAFEIALAARVVEPGRLEAVAHQAQDLVLGEPALVAETSDVFQYIAALVDIAMHGKFQSCGAGLKSEDPAVDPRKILEAWEEKIYHHPQDDMNQPGLDFEAGAKYARIAFLCGLYTANDAAAPAWKAGDFFGTAFAKGAARRERQ